MDGNLTYFGENISVQSIGMQFWRNASCMCLGLYSANAVNMSNLLHGGPKKVSLVIVAITL